MTFSLHAKVNFQALYEVCLAQSCPIAGRLRRIHQVPSAQPSRIIPLPDDILISVFQELLAARAPGREDPSRYHSPPRKKLAAVFVRLSLVSRRFQRLAQPFLFAELTATEIQDHRLGECLQETFYSRQDRHNADYVRTAFVFWDLQDDTDLHEDLQLSMDIELNRSRARIHSTLANLSYCKNLTRLHLILRNTNVNTSEPGYHMLPTASQLYRLPFLSTLKHLKIEDGGGVNYDDLQPPWGMDDCRTLSGFLCRLTNLRSLSTVGHDLTNMDLRSAAEDARLLAPWQQLQRLDINKYTDELHPSSNASFAFLLSATSATLRSIRINMLLASTKLAVVMDQCAFPRLENLSLTEAHGYFSNSEQPVVSYNWSTFFDSIANCTTLELDFCNRHDDSSFTSFLSALKASKDARRTLKKLTLAIRGPHEGINPILALDSLSTILPIDTFQDLEELEFVLDELDCRVMERTAEQFMHQNPALSTLSHVLVYKMLLLIEVAQSKATDITLRINPCRNSYAFDTVNLIAKTRIIKISAQRPRNTLIALLLTPPIRAVIQSLEGQRYKVKWAI